MAVRLKLRALNSLVRSALAQGASTQAPDKATSGA